MNSAKRLPASSARAALGAVVGRLLALLHGYAEDPISHHYGIFPDPTPAAKRIASEMGWTLPEIDAALDSRVSAKWAYNSGLGEVLRISEGFLS